MLYCKFNVRDWTQGTEGMRAVERAAYHSLINEMYEINGPIKISGAGLASILSCSERNAYRLVRRLIVAGKIIKAPDGSLVNVRAMWEIGLFWEAIERRVKLATLTKLSVRAQRNQRVIGTLERGRSISKSYTSGRARGTSKGPLRLIHDPILAKANAERAAILLAQWQGRRSR
jgi:hypothetical protein